MNWRSHSKSFFEGAALNAYSRFNGRSLDSVLGNPFSHWLLLPVRFVYRHLACLVVASGRCSDYPLRVSTTAHSRGQCNIANRASRIFGPFDNRFRFSESCEQYITAAISSLLFGACETAIVGTIASVVIFALDCKMRFVAICKRPLNKLASLVPLFTHGDSATSIVGISNVIGIVATMHHDLPSARKHWMLCVRHLPIMPRSFGTRNPTEVPRPLTLSLI